MENHIYDFLHIISIHGEMRMVAVDPDKDYLLILELTERYHDLKHEKKNFPGSNL